MKELPAYFCFKTTDKKAAKKLIDFLDRLKVEPNSSHLYFAETIEGLTTILTESEKRNDPPELS